MRTSRISQFWNDRFRRRRKQDKEAPQHDEPAPPAELSQDKPDSTITAAIERNARRLSRIWKNDDDDSPAPSRSNSLRYIKSRRSFFRSNDQPILQEDHDEPQEPLPPPLERETILDKLRRRSQSLTGSRPSTSTGVPRRHTFFGGSADEEPPAVPTMPEAQSAARPRHVPISIDHLQKDKQTDGPGMAITSNDIQAPSHAFVEKPRSRPMSSSSSFSQLRVRPARTTFQQQSPPIHADSESSDEDVLTALPSMDFKEFHIAELRAPSSYTVPLAPKADRRVLQRVVPKVVDIVAPRPMSMISAQPSRKSAPPSRDRERHKSMAAPTSTPIGALEDGPKGDWSRTRHSWVGLGEGEFEQLEWDKLKQFMEAYGSGHDGGVVSVRAVGTDSDSSGSARNSNGAKFSNAQALAALEFGL